MRHHQRPGGRTRPRQRDRVQHGGGDHRHDAHQDGSLRRAGQGNRAGHQCEGAGEQTDVEHRTRVDAGRVRRPRQTQRHHRETGADQPHGAKVDAVHREEAQSTAAGDGPHDTGDAGGECVEPQGAIERHAEDQAHHSQNHEERAGDDEAPPAEEHQPALEERPLILGITSARPHDDRHERARGGWHVPTIEPLVGVRSQRQTAPEGTQEPGRPGVPSNAPAGRVRR